MTADVRPAPQAVRSAVGLRSRLLGLGSVFGKTVRDGRRTALVVGLLAGLMMFTGGAALMAEWPDEASRLQLAASIELLPIVVRGLLGDPVAIETMGGFLAWRFGNILPVMLGIWSVLALSSTLAGEARKGSLDLVVATPVSRRRIALQKAAGHVVLVTLAMLIAAVMTWATGLAFATVPGDEIPIANAVGQFAKTGLLMLAAGSVAFALAPVLGRGRAAGLGAVALFGGYLIVSYKSIAPTLEALTPFSWYAWMQDHRPMAGTWDWPPFLLLAAVAVGLLAVGVAAFERRDIGAVTGSGRVRSPGLPAGTSGPFVRQLADRTAGAVGWGVGIGIYGALIASSADAFIEAMSQMPGIDEMMARIYPGLDFREPSGLLQLAFFAFGSLLIGFTAAHAVGGLTSDENDRRLDVVLSHPASRVRWFVQTALASLAMVALAVAVAAGLIVVALAGAGGDVVSPLGGSVVLALYGAAFVGIGLAVAGLGWPRQAALATGAVGIATYLLSTLGNALQLPAWLVDLSLLEHVGQPMAGTYDPVGIAAMLVLAAGGVAVGAWGFNRRDIGR